MPAMAEVLYHQGLQLDDLGMYIVCFGGVSIGGLWLCTVLAILLRMQQGYLGNAKDMEHGLQLGRFAEPASCRDVHV